MPSIRCCPLSPLDFLNGALLTDLAYWGTADAFWVGQLAVGVDDPAAAVLLPAVVASILGIAGWAGGELCDRYRIAVIGEH